MGWWGGLLKEGSYFKYFHQRGAIIWGRGLIEGRLLFEEIWYVFAGIQTRSFRKFNKWSRIHGHCATWQLNNYCYAKIIMLEAFLSAINAVSSWWSWIYHEAILHYFGLNSLSCSMACGSTELKLVFDLINLSHWSSGKESIHCWFALV